MPRSRRRSELPRASKQRITEEDQAELAAARAALGCIAGMGDEVSGFLVVEVARYVLGMQADTPEYVPARTLWSLADARKQGTIDGA